MYYNYYQKPTEEAKSEMTIGIYSVNPTLSSLQEFILLYLKETAFYLLELKKLGIDNKAIKDNILEAVSGIVIGAEYNESQFQRLNHFLFDNLTQSKTLYKEVCARHNLDEQVLKSYYKHKKNYLLSEVIKRGEKYSIKKNTAFDAEQKQVFDIMLILLKSMCVRLLELRSLGHDFEEGYFAMLSLLNVMNFHHVSIERAKPEIESFIKTFSDASQRLHWCAVGAYGSDVLTSVSFSTRPGKAILISGHDLKELELVLKATEGRGVDIYTHGLEMLVAHTYPKLREHTHLVGHFSRSVESHIVDIANFPGPVLMSRHSLQKTEDLYHGNIYTTDSIPPLGAVKIYNNDFEPLIQAAHAARGFSLALQKDNVMVGYDEKEVKAVVNKVLDEMDAGKIKHIYFVGLLHDSDEHSQYFDNFFNSVPSDCFVFSLSYDIEKDNVYHIKSYYDYALIYKIFKEIEKRKPLSETNMTVFLNHCDKHIVSNVLNLRRMGIKNIFMCECHPILINPLLIGALRTFFGLKEFTNPKNDIEITLREEG